MILEKHKIILITNNQKVLDKYKDEVQVDFSDSYEEVLIKTRDLVYQGYGLLTHPQASSLKPNQTPYRSVLVYQEPTGNAVNEIMLVEKCIESFRQWQSIAGTPEDYPGHIVEDFQTIDLSVIEQVMERIG